MEIFLGWLAVVIVAMLFCPIDHDEKRAEQRGLKTESGK